jgi:hypothetical protein
MKNGYKPKLLKIRFLWVFAPLWQGLGASCAGDQKEGFLGALQMGPHFGEGDTARTQPM